MEVDDCLCGIGNCEDDLRPYLQTWQRENRAASLNHLTDFIGYNVRHMLKEKRLGNAFWEEREPQSRQIIEWLLDPAITKKLECFLQLQGRNAGPEALNCRGPTDLGA